MDTFRAVEQFSISEVKMRSIIQEALSMIQQYLYFSYAYMSCAAERKWAISFLHLGDINAALSEG